MDKIAKIRAEIERRIALSSSLSENTVNPNRIDEDRQLLSFIDSLEEEPEPIDWILYAAACGIKNAGNEDDCTKEAARRYGYNYSNECPGMVQSARDGFIAGAEWKEEQMMSGAVEADVADLNRDIYNQCIEKGMTDEDKLKLIILGGDEKDIKRQE